MKFPKNLTHLNFSHQRHLWIWSMDINISDYETIVKWFWACVFLKINF